MSLVLLGAVGFAALLITYGGELIRFVVHRVSYPQRHRETVEAPEGWTPEGLAALADVEDDPCFDDWERAEVESAERVFAAFDGD